MPLNQQVFRQYETVMLLRPETPEPNQDQVRARIGEIIEKAGGRIARWETWGKRRLAFEIDKQQKAYYVYMNYVTAQGSVAELERNLRIMEPVMMYQTVKLSDLIDIATFDFEAEAAKKSPLYMSPEDAAAMERSYQREREWAAGAVRGDDDDDDDYDSDEEE